MKTRGFDPLRLDVQSFVKEAAQLEGSWPLAGMARLVDMAHADAIPQAAEAARWHVQGEVRRVRSDEPQLWLHLKAGTHIALICQRCLQPVGVDIDAQRSFRFVPGENLAAELDADCEDDVLALPRSLDLRALVEEELLLSLPLVPMHLACPLPLPLSAVEPAVLDEQPHPFAVLGALKQRGPVDQG